MRTIEGGSRAGAILELTEDMVKQGRMSRLEAQAIRELLWNPEFPESFCLRSIVPGHPPGTDTEKPPGPPADRSLIFR